jgi:hypothetical protein
MSPGAIPTIDWGWMFPTWLSADGTNGTVSSVGTTLARQTYTNTVLNTIRDCDIRLRSVAAGSALPAFFHANKISIDTTIKHSAIRSPNGPFSSTVRGYMREEVFEEDEVKLSLQTPMENNLTYDVLQAAQGTMNFAYQIGTSATRGGVLIDVPRLQFKQKPQRLDDSGVRNLTLELGSMLDTDATDGCVPAGGATISEIAQAEAALRIMYC